MADVEAQFEWPVPVAGFRLVAEPEFALRPEGPVIGAFGGEVDVRPPWLVGLAVEESRRGDLSRTYDPVREHPGLHREFAALPTVEPAAEDAVTAFASRYGSLVGGNLALLTRREGLPVTFAGESLGFWRLEIQQMRDTLWLWDSVRGNDARLREVIRWAGGVPIYMPGADAFEDEFERLGSLGKIQAPKAQARVEKLLAEIVHHAREEGRSTVGMRVIADPGFRDTELARWRKSRDVVGPAWSVLGQIVSEKLRGAVSLAVDAPREGQVVVKLAPHTLLGALWFMLFREIGGAVFRACPVCGRIFDASRSPNRQYCTTRGAGCRLKAYRLRRDARAVLESGKDLDHAAQLLGISAHRLAEILGAGESPEEPQQQPLQRNARHGSPRQQIDEPGDRALSSRVSSPASRQRPAP